jgi:N-acyl-D-amino-acid deacylase
MIKEMQMKRNVFFRAFIFPIIFSISLTTLIHGGSSAADYDVLIRGGRVLDGSGKKAIQADVAVKDGRIVKVGGSVRGSADKVIDASGLIVTPGFIDLHTHVEGGMQYPENRACLNYLKQGVTTVIVGHCGSHGWPMVEKASDRMARWSSEGIGPNAALLAGHGDVRRIVMGMENRAPTPDELTRMRALVKEAMEQGAYGFSTGLVYEPGSFGDTDEVIALVAEITPYGGIYHTHVRNEEDMLIEAVKEAIEICEKTGAATHISHFKVIGKPYWGSVKEACALIEAARARGLKITADQYPYRYHSNNPYASLIPAEAWTRSDNLNFIRGEDITSIFEHLRDSELIALYAKTTPFTPINDHHRRFLDELPRDRLVNMVARQFINARSFYSLQDGRARMFFLQRMKDPETASEIRAAVGKRIEEESGAENIIIAVCVEDELEGKSIAQVAEMRGMSAEDVAIELELMGAKVLPMNMCEEDIEYIMKKDWVGTGSDGEAPFYGIGVAHCRSYSTFLHKIKKYSLERKAVSLPHVIRSQTSLPASIMGWDDRGKIEEGYKADIALIDLNGIKTPTSIHNPHRYSEGVSYLLVNGETVIDGGEWTGALPGEIIKLKK